MRHQCTACRREFFDDSGGLPESDRIYCVFCGTPIALRRPERARRAAVPFSDERPAEGAALGIIKADEARFPDTLRQFAVPTRKGQLARLQSSPQPSLVAARRSDTFRPVARGGSDGSSAHASNARAPRSLRRKGAVLLALLAGFAAGGLIALGLTEYGRADSPADTALPQPAVAKPAAQPPQPARAPIQASPTPGCATPVAAPSASVAVSKATKAALDRSWLLDRARFHQRAYRLDDAERAYRKLLALAPSDSEALAGLGELELLRGTLDRADQRFQQALQANADFLPAKVAVADIRWQAGRAADAREAYREIVQQYAVDAYPPYVAKRSASAAFPDCDDDSRPANAAAP